MSEKNQTLAVTVIKRLGGQAPSFDLPVTFGGKDGGTLQLTLTCKALKKTEWAAAKDKRQRELLENLYKADPALQEAVAEPKSKKATKATKAKTEEAAAEKTPLQTALETLEKRGVSAALREGMGSDAALVMEFATGWELEDVFNLASVTELENEYGGAITAILSAYDKAIFQGRLGN